VAAPPRPHGDVIQRPGVLALFMAQHGVASTAQLAELGISASAVHRAVRAGLVERVLPGVLGLAGGWSRFESRCAAATLAAGADGFLSECTAATLHGVERLPTGPIHVTTHERHKHRWPEWVCVHTTSWLDVEERPPRDDLLVVASPLRTLFGLASALDEYPFRRAAEALWRTGLVTPSDARAYLGRIRRQGRTGVARLERWIDRVDGQESPVDSGLELLLADLATEAGLPEPVRQHSLRLRSGRTIHLDLAWPELRLAVEPGHTRWHGSDDRLRADQARDRGCAEVGWMVVRFDESVWERRDLTVRELRRIHHRRAEDLGRSPAPPISRTLPRGG
jgi:hypothetical protein